MLMLAALVITGTVGSMLVASWPASADDAVPLSALARLLSVPGEEPLHEPLLRLPASIVSRAPHSTHGSARLPAANSVRVPRLIFWGRRPPYTSSSKYRGRRR